MTAVSARPVDAAAPAELGPRPTNRFPGLALSIAVGLLMVSVAFAAGRAGAPWGQAVFWAGQLLMFVPITARFLWADITEREAIGGVYALAVGYYLTKLSYSPLQLKYNDELQHWGTAQDILLTNHLFNYNASLPVSPLYPGLETVTTAFASIAGVSATAAAFVVMGVVRVLFTGALYLLIRRISGSVRIAALSAVLFTTTFHYKTLLAIFSYTSTALAFLVLTMLAVVRLTTEATSTAACRTNWCLAAMCICVTIVTHHITSYVLVLTLVLGSAVLLMRRQRTQAVRVGVLALLSAVGIGLWIGLVAPGTVEYVEPAYTQLLDGAREALDGSAPQQGARPPTGPIPDRVLSYLGVLVIAVLLPIGWRRASHASPGPCTTRGGSAPPTTRGNNAWVLAMVVGSTLFYLIPAIRLLSTSGSEHAARVLDYLFVPIGFVLATAAFRIASRGFHHRWLAIAGTTALLGLVMASGITGGWPPYWERLPSDHPLISGSESGVEPEDVAAGHWSTALPKGSRMAGDWNNTTIMSPYGDQEFQYGVAPLYYNADLNAEDRALLADKRIAYVVADRRLSEQLPANGEYFPGDQLALQHNAPLPLDQLTKFDRVHEASRVFDSGNIVIYDVQAARRAP